MRRKAVRSARSTAIRPRQKRCGTTALTEALKNKRRSQAKSIWVTRSTCGSPSHTPGWSREQYGAGPADRRLLSWEAWQMRTTITTLTAATMIVLATSAQAAPTLVNVRIEGKSETLFEGPIWSEGHDVEASSDTQERSCDGIDPLDPQNKTPGATPTAAAADAMSLIEETFDGQWYPGYDDYSVTRWGPDEQDPVEAAYWGILVNDVFTNVGGCQYELHENDEALWVYDAFKGRASLALFPVGDNASRPPLTATAQLDQPFAVQVDAYGDDKEDSPPAEPDRADATPYEGAEVSPVLTSAKGFERVQITGSEAVTTDSDGKASIVFTTPGWHRIKAGTPLGEGGEEEAIRSNRIDICVPALGETGC